MTRPFDLPQPGTPLGEQIGELYRVLAELAAQAGREDSMQHGAVGSEGAMSAPPPQVSIGLFKLTGRWTQADQGGLDWPTMPSLSSWYYAPATRVEYYAGAQTWNTPADEGDAATVPESGYVWHQAGMQLGSVDPSRALPASLEAAGDFMPAAGNGQWVWCFYDEGPGCWVMLQPFEDIIRVELTENWYSCRSATARMVLAKADADQWQGFYTSSQLTVYDPLGRIANDLLSVCDSNGNWYMPSGTYAYVKRFADDNAWEPLGFMPGNCPTGSSGSGSSSGIGPPGPGSSSGAGCVCHTICGPTGLCIDSEGRIVGVWDSAGNWWSPIGCPSPGPCSSSSSSSGE